MSPRRSVNENSLLMVWKECQLLKRPISRFLFSQTLLIKNRQVINVGNALENRVIKTSADGQKPVSTFASLHFQVFSGFIDR